MPKNNQHKGAGGNSHQRAVQKTARTREGPAGPVSVEEKSQIKISVIEAPRSARAKKQGQISNKGRFRVDLSLAFIVAVMAIAIVIAPPETLLKAILWFVAMFLLGIYPVLHLTDRIPILKPIANTLSLLIWAGMMTWFGLIHLPHPHRHTLRSQERAEFQNALKPQRDGDLIVQLACPTSDEKVCTYAGQFVNLFGGSGWKIDPGVMRVTFARAADGITVYRRGGNKQYSMSHWDAGGYFAINEPHLLAVQSAFKRISIEIDGGTYPDLAENTMMIYFGPEKENESEPTGLTRSTEWATGKRTGPFPIEQP